LWGDDLRSFTCLFSGKSTREEVLTTNGDYIIDDLIISDKITEGLNDKFDYQSVLIVDKEKPKELYNLFVEGSIIRVSDEFGDEVFRICNVRKNKKEIEIYARQITISDTLNLWLEDVRPTNQSGTSAIQYIFNGAKGKNEIIATSNITKINTAYYMYMNVYKALFDNDNSFLERWGGEIYRNKYNLAINNRVGQDKDIIIQSKKNLIGFEIKTNIDSLCTVIYPVGFDGIKADRVISPLVNNYPRQFFKEIKYEDVKLKTENDPEGYDTLAQAQTELKRRAELEFSKNHIDIITAEYNINFVELYKTEEYKNYGLTEYAGIGDTITVKEDTYNTDIIVRVIEREYSPKLDRRLSTKLSNKDIKLTPPNVSQIIAELDKAQKQGANGLGDYINALMNSGIKDSYVIAKQNEILIMDSKDINTSVNVVRLNRNGLGFSQTGYYGRYEYGFTIDGKINASLISTGILSTVLIQNWDGSLQIDLSSKESGIKFKKNGYNGITIEGQSQYFYDWEDEKRQVTPTSAIYSSRSITTSNAPGLVLAHNLNNYMTLSYVEEEFNEKNGFIARGYILLDKLNKRKQDTNKFAPIQIYTDSIIYNSLFFQNTTNEIFGSLENNLVLKSNNNINLADSSKKTFASFSGSKSTIWSDTTIVGDFTVSGNKNCVQETVKHGKVAYYSIEDCESYLTERSKRRCKTENNICKIYLDDIFLESTIGRYTIEIFKYSWGDYRILEQENDYFIVESEKDEFEFDWVVTRHRNGFEDERLKVIEPPKPFYKAFKPSFNFESDERIINTAPLEQGVII